MEALEIAWNHDCSSSSRTEHAGQQPVGRNTTPTHVDLRDKPACLTDFLRSSPPNPTRLPEEGACTCATTIAKMDMAENGPAPPCSAYGVKRHAIGAYADGENDNGMGIVEKERGRTGAKEDGGRVGTNVPEAQEAIWMDPWAEQPGRLHEAR